MKSISTMLAFIGIFNSLFSSTALEIKIEPCWRYLDSDKINAEKYGGSWILACIISIKKRTKEDLILDKLILSWKGQQIDSLLGSVYRKTYEKKFLAIEENLLADGNWNRKEQKLICKFDKPVILSVQNEFCFVLTIPDHLESIIKSGRFELTKEELPSLLVEALPKRRSLIIAFDKQSNQIGMP